MGKILVLSFIGIVFVVCIILFQRSQKIPLGNNATSKENSASDHTSLTAKTNSTNPQFTLQINSPQNNSTVTTPAITVSGRTMPNANVVIDEAELKADSDGSFSTNVDLDEGENYITVVASDSDGNYAEQDVSVTLNSK